MDDTSARTLADLGEDELLGALFPHFPSADRDVVGPGDDAAVVAVTSGAVVATTDTMVRGRDWLDEWSSPGDVAVKCLTQNLADLAAMGARPTSVLVTLVADPATRVDWVVDFARVLGAEAQAAGVTVVGGDLSSAGPGTLAVSVTALGDLQGREPVCRDGAAAGDVLALSGSLGRSAAGWWLLRHADEGPVSTGLAADLVQSHVAPRTRVVEGVVASDAGATSMIDVSDGLLRDAGRVARASGIRLELSRAALARWADELAPAVGLEVAWECVLGGGEEHSLLATYASEQDVPRGWHVIGDVLAGAGVSVDGEPAAPAGWDHFAG